MAKYKTTGCFKFLIFLIIAVPIAFLISSYYHGEDPLAAVKEKLIEISDSTGESQTSSRSENDESILEINELRNQIRDLERENDNLSKLLKEKQKEIDVLKSGF